MGGILALVEDRPTPKAVYNWRVYALAAVASFASCMIGYDSAFIGTTLALKSFTKEFDFASLSDEALATTKANIVSVYQAGAFFGALAGYAGGFFLGRKWGLVLFALIFEVGAAIMLAAGGSRGLGPLLAGRVLAGFGIGGASNLVPIYISELAPPAVRGRLVGIYELGWQIGGLVGFWINYGIALHVPESNKQWIIPFAVQLIPGGLLFLGALWLKESPRWLYSKGRREEGLKNLMWVRQLPSDDLYLVEDVAAIDAAIEAQRGSFGSGFWAPFKALASSRRVQWRFVLGGMLFMFQNGSGINAVNYYSPTIFKSLGIVGTNTGFLTTGLFGVVKTCLTLIWLFVLIDRLGRRNLLLGGALGGSICMWVIGGLLKAYPPVTATTTSTTGSSGTSGSAPVTTTATTTSTAVPSHGIAAIFFFYLWTTFYTPSWNGTPWVLNSEMFDMTTRSLGQANAAMNNWFWNFIISRFTPNMFLNMGAGGFGVYMFFASMMLLSIVFVFFLVPETKGIPLEAMDRLFEINPKRNAHRIVSEELMVEEEEFRRNASVAGLDAADDKSMRHVEDFNYEHAHVEKA